MLYYYICQSQMSFSHIKLKLLLCIIIILVNCHHQFHMIYSLYIIRYNRFRSHCFSSKPPQPGDTLSPSLFRIYLPTVVIQRLYHHCGVLFIDRNSHNRISSMHSCTLHTHANIQDEPVRSYYTDR